MNPVGLTPDELRAKVLGLKAVVFDFDGVFTDNGVYLDQHGNESVRCSRIDGMGIGLIRKLGLDPMILSTEVNPVVMRRAEKLKMPCVHGCEDKLTGLQNMLDERGVSPEHASFMGNDINDKPALEMVGLPVVVADAHPSVASLGQLVSANPGGHGAVREFCDLILETWLDAGHRL